MRDPITRFETVTTNGRTTLVGLTDLGDWKWLARFDSSEDIESWCGRIGGNGPTFRQWFIEKGLVAA